MKKDNNEIEDIRFAMPKDDDILFHEIKVFDGEANLKKIIPPMTYAQWKLKKIMTRTPRQWAYWNLAERELPS